MIQFLVRSIDDRGSNLDLFVEAPGHNMALGMWLNYYGFGGFTGPMPFKEVRVFELPKPRRNLMGVIPWQNMPAHVSGVQVNAQGEPRLVYQGVM